MCTHQLSSMSTHPNEHIIFSNNQYTRCRPSTSPVSTVKQCDYKCYYDRSYRHNQPEYMANWIVVKHMLNSAQRGDSCQFLPCRSQALKERKRKDWHAIRLSNLWKMRVHPSSISANTASLTCPYEIFPHKATQG